MKECNDQQTYTLLYRLSAEVRGLHWLRALLITALIVTGFYLAKPFLIPEPTLEPVNFQNALVRFWHVVFGFGLAFVTIMRIFLFFFDDHSSRHERASFRDTVSLTSWRGQFNYYLMRGSFQRQGAYGPLQLLAYLILMLLLFFQILTGMILHSANYHDGLGGFLDTLLGPLSVWLGGLTGVSNFHYLNMWIIIIFIPIHLYMVYWAANRTPGGTVETMFSGYGFKKTTS